MKILFFVEGDSERNLIEAICQRAAEYRLYTGGSEVSAQKIAEKFSELIGKKTFDYYVILADFDRRNVPSKFNKKISLEDFEQNLQGAIYEQLTKSGRATLIPKVFVGICHRDFENWIYAGLTGAHKDGEDSLELISAQIGSKYSKSTSPKHLYLSKQLTFSNALASPSFARFASKLPPGLCPKLEQALTA